MDKQLVNEVSIYVSCFYSNHLQVVRIFVKEQRKVNRAICRNLQPWWFRYGMEMYRGTTG